MKLLRFGEAGQEKPGLLAADGSIRDLSTHLPDINPDTIAVGVLDLIGALDPAALPVVPALTRLGPPIARTGHFIGIGLNYADHAAEAGLPIPSEPIVFSKAPSSLSGPDDDILLPDGADKADWEVELAVIIGRRAFNVSEAEALAHVAGYAVCNDVSERAWQMERGGQWMKGKSYPTFGPLGPWLVTADEVPDPQNLTLSLSLNGRIVQRSTTAQMIFSVREIIAYLSRFMTLEPGDVITTGTPPGVGLGMKPPLFLKVGDRMELEIAGLGRQRQTVRRLV